MIEMYIDEFLAVYKALTKHSEAITNGLDIAVPKRVLDELLMKYPFEEPEQKLEVWRALGLLRCEAGRFTKRMRVNGQRTYMAALSGQHYELLQAIQGIKKPTKSGGDRTNNEV